MAFNVDKLFTFCIAAIERFAAGHQNELFYAFAVDENFLCLNSEEAFAATLKKYQDRWDRRNRPVGNWDDLTEDDLWRSEYLLDLEARNSGLDRSDKIACLAVINESRSRYRDQGNPYRNPLDIQSLRENTGDWAYQGFAVMAGLDGFDKEAYGAHYDMSDEEQKTSAYGRAMDTLVERLREANAFACLATSQAFYATRVEHRY